jgi:hypothetical protein
MGFLDKLKSVKNMVTGGGAKVTVQLGQVQLGVPIPVIVRAQIEGGAISPSKVYVAVRAVETTKLQHRTDEGKREDVEDTETTFSQEFPITGPLQLAPNSMHEWQGQIVLPTSVQPTYHGRHAKHEWSVLAALDVTGNDPDSGWIEFHVR